jgi:hypothetical protein
MPSVGPALFPTAAVDAACIVTFAAMGRAAHGERGGNSIGKTAAAAAPFVIGWWVAAPLLGVYRSDALSSYRVAVERTIPAWLLGGTIGLIIRSVREGRIVPLSFAAISLAIVLSLLVPCRLVIVALSRRP